MKPRITRRKFLAFLAAFPGVGYVANRALGAADVQDTTVTHAKIHPAIGIARVGNSRNEFFIGPEVPDAPSLPVGSYKDATGALKRQAARFRIYGYNAAGEVVRELTPDNADITWTVHLANKKASWYEFRMALDIREASLDGFSNSPRRNLQVTGSNREKLVIDPGPRSIRGKSIQGETSQFNTGKFFDLTVPLGELRTDDAGRLLVLGGYGLSRSYMGRTPDEFANNDGWHDDTSDGTVDAVVKVGDTEIPVTGAWVVAAPPNYAPALKTVRTLHDLLYDCAIKWSYAKAPESVTFSRHIAPIFLRMSGLQWVNDGFASIFGFGNEFDAEQLMGRLADASEANKLFRQQTYARFRNVRTRNVGKLLWPYLYGDAWDYLDNREQDVTTRLDGTMSQLSDTQLNCLKKWADGEFVDDRATAKPVPTSLTDVPLRDQPAALDEAALAFCLADAFHPGCELTWIMRTRSLYDSPLRIHRRPADSTERDFGNILTPRIAMSDTGPLVASGPGDLTRWMAVPWQTDTVSCLWAYEPLKISESLPSFWPARVPNQVLSEADYKMAMDANLPIAQRAAAFARRRDWFRGFGQHENINLAVTDYHKLGIIEERPGATDVAQLPARMFVESRPDMPQPDSVLGENAKISAGGAFFRMARMLRKVREKVGLV